MYTKRVLVAAAFALAFAALSPQIAPAQVRTAAVVRTAHIREYERVRASSRVDPVHVIYRYYEERPATRPSHPGRGYARGHAKGAYPTGWDRYIKKHETLSPVMRAYYAPAPVALVRVLPPLPRGMEYAIIGNRVLVVDRPSWLIVDVLVAL